MSIFRQLSLSRFGCLILAIGVSQNLFAQTTTQPPNSAAKPTQAAAAKKPAEEDDDSIIRKPKETSEPVAKEFSSAERTKACNKFTGKIVSVGGEIWKIKDCTRHQIHDADALFRMSRAGASVVEADARDLAAIPVGISWEAVQNAKPRPCSTFNSRYVTYSFTDIYFVERCIRRLIPDYETLLRHRKDRKDKNSEILALTDAEFHAMRQGRDIPSEVDREFAKLLDGSAGVDVIPIDEACRGLEGKLVSFYARLYRIEKCRKRELDAEAFTMKNKGKELRTIELKAEQWLSLPDGKPLKD